MSKNLAEMRTICEQAIEKTLALGIPLCIFDYGIDMDHKNNIYVPSENARKTGVCLMGCLLVGQPLLGIADTTELIAFIYDLKDYDALQLEGGYCQFADENSYLFDPLNEWYLLGQELHLKYAKHIVGEKYVV